MSLINKMLQDLDARGSQASAPLHGTIKSVLRPEARLSVPLVAGVALGVGVLAAAGVFGWRTLKSTASPAAPIVIMASAAPPAPAPVLTAVVAVPPAPVALPVVAPAVQVARKVPAPVRQAEVSSVPAPERPRMLAAAVPERPMAPPQRAESEYRRALASLQEGRIGDSMARLEQVLQLDPRHEAARQTLVGLLIEDRRVDQAVAQLQAGLTLDARQPALAMLLARLQIERGGSGIDTLQRSLSAAGGNADYHAFLAGALQREQRHVEAAEHYRIALGLAPDNGVWLMGMGISLQADQRRAEAQGAFQRAQASGTLSPQLQAFVDSQLQQLQNRGQTSD